MIRNSRRGTEAGFTLQEVLVALVVGSLLIGFSLSLFHFSSSLFSTWQNRSSLRESVNGILLVMTKDIRSADRVIEHSDSTLVLSQGMVGKITYEFNVRGIFRNGTLMTPPENPTLRIGVTTKGIERRNLPFLETVEVRIQGFSKRGQYEAWTDVALLSSARMTFERSAHAQF